MNDETKKYLTKMKDKNCNEQVIIQQEIESLCIQKEEYEKQIEKSKAEIDTAYDVFSAKPIKNQFYREQIQNFQQCLEKIDSQLADKYIMLEKRKSEIEELDMCINEISTTEEKQSEVVEQEIDKKDIETLLYKCENAKSFLMIDRERSSMELEEVIKYLRKIIGTI